jgi:hypothetical protein
MPARSGLADRGQTTWLERLGAALVMPARAMAASDTSGGSGRAPADLAVLILAGFMASRLPRLVKAGWLAADGAAMDGAHMLLADLSAQLMAPLLFVVIGGVALTIAAGRRRSLAADFDLACVAAVPLGAIPPLLHLASRLGADMSADLLAAATWTSYAWGAALLIVAQRQARRRQTPAGAAA